MKRNYIKDICLFVFGFSVWTNSAEILLLDHLAGQSINEVCADRSGKLVFGGGVFEEGGFDRGFWGAARGHGGCVRYPGKGNFNPQQGTMEFYVILGDNWGKTKNHEHLANLTMDEKNCMGLYYNIHERKIVFWLRDSDTPGENIHQKDYNVLMTSGILDWQPGERHHIAVSWEREHEVLFIDGRPASWQNFRGSITAEWKPESRIDLARNSNFIIDVFRIWDDARAPRNISQKPSVKDGTIVYSRKFYSKNGAAATGEDIRCKDFNLVFDSHSPLPVSMVRQTDKLELMACPATWRLAGKPLRFQGKWKNAGSGQLQGKFQVADYPGLWLELKVWRDKQAKIVWDSVWHNDGIEPFTGDLTLELPMLTEASQAFMSTVGAPFPVREGNAAFAHGRRGFQVMGHKPHAYLPLMSTYLPEQGVGFSVFQNMDVPEYLNMDFGDDCSADAMAMTNVAFTIKPGQRRSLRYYLAFHDADWRAALRTVRKHAPATFEPGIKQADKAAHIDGGMIIGGPSHLSFLNNMKEAGVAYREVTVGNGKQVVFGEYVPDNPTDETRNYFKGINAEIRALHHSGILGMLYMQARECKRLELAKERFPESIRYDSRGKIVESYSFGAKMLCAPGTPWFDHLLDQHRRMLKEMPEADGIFFDNSWDKEYAPIINAVAREVHDRGLLIATNGASAGCAGASDSIMAEGTRTALAEIAFLGLRQTIIYVPIYSYYAFSLPKEKVLAAPSVMANLERDLKACLEFGAFYAFNYRGNRYFSPEAHRLYRHYMPLQNELKGKHWHLATRALELPEGFRGNVFRQPNGNLLVYVISDGLPFAGKPVPDFAVTVNPEKLKIARASVRHLEDDGEREQFIHRLENGRLKLNIKGHRSVTMIKLAPVL